MRAGRGECGVSHFEAALEGVQTNELGKLRLG
jgi:hypothetical protein